MIELAEVLLHAGFTGPARARAGIVLTHALAARARRAGLEPNEPLDGDQLAERLRSAGELDERAYAAARHALEAARATLPAGLSPEEAQAGAARLIAEVRAWIHDA